LFDAVELRGPPRIFFSEPGWRWHAVIPDYYNLWVVLAGTGEMTVDGARYPLATGRAFLLAPGRTVEAAHDPRDPIRNFAAHFVPVRFGRRIGIPPGNGPTNVTLRDAGVFADLARYAVRLGQSGDPLGLRQAAALVFALALHTLRSARLPPWDSVEQRVRELMEQIRMQPGRRRTVAGLARAAGMSRVHFARRFHAVAGEPPSLFLIRRRVERAAQLIRESRLKLADVAEQMGYSDVYFFSRQFKKITGVSPGRWRRAARGGE